jgi:hypothetical protein
MGVAVERDEVIPREQRVKAESVDEEGRVTELGPGGVLRRKIDTPMRTCGAAGYSSFPVLA